MDTLFGIMFGYVLRGTTESEGFREIRDTVERITDTDEFRSFVGAVKDHARVLLRDLSNNLSQHADHFSEAIASSGGEVLPLPDGLKNPWKD